jgi:tRNA (guanine37-N1)-methyltransferase
MEVPEVLVNGNHEQIRSWRRKTALAKTLRNRPDLLQRVRLTAEDEEFLAQIKLDQGTHRDEARPVSTKD